MKLLQVTLIGLFLLTEAMGQIMPEGFQDLAIGMNWKEVIEVRPDAEILNLGPDPEVELTPNPEEPQGGLLEMINTGPTKIAVLYVFNDGRLSMLSFSYSSESGIGDSLLREFLDRYGKHENIQGSLAPGHGIVKWITGNLNLYLTIPFENAEDRDEFAGAYQIMDMQMAQEIEAEINKGLRKKPVDEISLQTFKSRVQALSNSILSQETQKPVVAAERTPELESTEQNKLQPQRTTKFIFGDESDQQVSDEKSNTLPYVIIGLVIITLIVIAIIVKAHKQ